MELSGTYFTMCSSKSECSVQNSQREESGRQPAVFRLLAAPAHSSNKGTGEVDICNLKGN